MDDDELISISEAARRLGLNKSTVSRQVGSGLLRNHNGKLRLSEVLADRSANLDRGQRERWARPRPSR